jgi:hypothetical protein
MERRQKSPCVRSVDGGGRRREMEEGWKRKKREGKMRAKVREEEEEVWNRGKERGRASVDERWLAWPACGWLCSLRHIVGGPLGLSGLRLVVGPGACPWSARRAPSVSPWWWRRRGRCRGAGRVGCPWVQPARGKRWCGRRARLLLHLCGGGSRLATLVVSTTKVRTQPHSTSSKRYSIRLRCQDGGFLISKIKNTKQ